MSRKGENTQEWMFRNYELYEAYVAEHNSKKNKPFDILAKGKYIIEKFLEIHKEDPCTETEFIAEGLVELLELAKTAHIKTDEQKAKIDQYEEFYWTRFKEEDKRENIQ